MIIKSAYLTLPDDSPSSSPAIRIFVKFLVIGDWLSHTDKVPLLVGTLIITAYTLKMVGLMIYIHYTLAKKRSSADLIQIYWSMMHMMHPLVLFFWIHTFSMEIINYSYHYDFHGGLEVFLTIAAYFNIAVNCILAVVFSIISLSYKTKDVLSCKTSILHTKTVACKIIIPLLWVAGHHSEGAQILALVIGLIGSIIHDIIFVRYLPYYKINMLFLSAVLQAALTSLALISCIVKFIEIGRGNDIGILSVQVVWLLIVPFWIKAYHLITWKIITRIFGAEPNEEKNVAYLVHKTLILLYFLEHRKVIHEGVNHLSFSDLMYQAKMARVTHDSGISFHELDRDRKLILKGLKPISMKIYNLFPKEFLAQINLAYFFTQFDDHYLISNTLIEDVISKDPGFHAQVSLNMIRLDLQKKLALQFSQKSAASEQEGLNVHDFIINQDLHQKVKNSIEKQCKMQVGFWKEFLLSKPDMLNLLNTALKINNQKKVVKRIWSDLLKTRPSSFLSPLMVYGMYSSLVNNDSVEAEKYIEQSHEDAKRLRKFFKADEFTNHTVFSDKTVKVIMSGLKSKLGKILNCSDNISFSYGWQGKEMKGKPVTSLMPQFYRQRHDRFLNVHYNTGKTRILNKTTVIPVKGANGYIVPTWMHVKASPMVENGIFYVALLKPCSSNQRMVLVKKDGRIDDMSLDFAQEMNIIDKEDLDIFELCPEFKQVNDAFNMIANNTVGTINTTSDLQVCKVSFSSRRKGSSNSMLVKNAVSKITKKDLQETQNTTILLDKTLPGMDTSRLTDRPLLQKGTEGDEIARKKPISSLEMRIERMHQNSLQTDSNSSPRDNKSSQEIYDSFVAGSTLVFYPKSSACYPSRGNKISLLTVDSSENNSKPITYNVKVTNNIYGKDVIKFVMLEKVSQDEDSEEGGFSEEEDLKMASKAFVRDAAKRKKVDGKDELVSPSFLPSPSQFSPSRWKAEDPSSMYLNSPPKIKVGNNFSLSDIVANEKEEGMNLSILDEVQSSDSVARKAVFRSVVEEKESPNNKLAVPITMTEEAEVSFSPNPPKRGSGRVSFVISQTHSQTDSKRTREGRKSITYSQNQLLDLFGAKRRQSAGNKDLRSATIIENNRKSTWFFHGGELPKEDRLLKTKLKKLKQRLEDAVVNVNKAENSVSSSYISKGKKVQHLVSQALKIDPKKRSTTLYVYSFAIFILAMVILLITQTINLYKGIRSVENQIPVITTAFFRQNAMISSYTGMRAWNAVLQGDYTSGDWMSDNLLWQDYLEPYTEDLKEYNTEFYEQLNNIPAVAQTRFFDKDVGLYDYEDDGSKSLVTVSSTFEGIQKMLQMEYTCLNMEIPASFEAGFDNYNFKFVLDNIMNDLLINSERQITGLTFDLADSINDTTFQMGATMVAALIVAAAFFAISIRFLYAIASEANVFMIMIFRMKPRDCEAIQTIIQRFRDALATNLKNFELPGEEKTKEDESKKNNSNYAKFRSASMDSLYYQQRMNFVKLIPNYALFIIWGIVYYFLTSNFITNVQSCERQMEAALQAKNNQSLFLAEFIDLSLTNGTALVRNENFMADFRSNLRNIQDTSSLFADHFRDKDGQLTELQEEIIYDYPCDELLELDGGKFAKAYEYCVEIGAGDPSTGLVDITTFFYSFGRQILERYENSVKTKEELQEIFLEILEECGDMANLAEAFLTALYESTHSKFHDQVDLIQENTITFTVSIAIISLIGSILSWKLVVNRIFRDQKIDRHILQIIPIKLILSNKHLQQYLLKHSDGILDGVKTFL